MVTNDPTDARLAAAKNYIDWLTPGDRVAILDFDLDCNWTRENVGGPEHHLDSPGHDGIPNYTDPQADVDTIDANGGTNLLCPIEYTIAELTARGDPNVTWAGILLTDGVDSFHTDAQILAAAQNASDAGIVIHTIGLGSAVHEPLLEGIANLTGGMYFHASSSDRLLEGYQSALDHMQALWDAPPAPTLDPQAQLSGDDLVLTWDLSADDTGGVHDVASYEIWRRSGPGAFTYNRTGEGYAHHTTVPAGTASYVHVNATVDFSNGYYQVRTVDKAGHVTRAPNQAGFSHQFASGQFERVLRSFRFIPPDPRIEVVLQDSAWRVLRTYVDGEWLTWDRDRPEAASLRTVNVRRGYWVHHDGPDDWIEAGQVPLDTTIDLRTGWNMVGHPRYAPSAVADVLAGVPYTDIEWFVNEAPYFLRSIDTPTMHNGNGYWIRVAQDAALTYVN
jgi:hypothetical protein